MGSQDIQTNVDPRIQQINHLGRVKIYAVNGTLIRNKVYIDFIGGGHGYIYSFIPKDEIWIDNDFLDNPVETEAIILHEMVERRLMQKGMKYQDAHDLANIVEVKWREKNGEPKNESQGQPVINNSWHARDGDRSRTF